MASICFKGNVAKGCIRFADNEFINNERGIKWTGNSS